MLNFKYFAYFIVIIFRLHLYAHAPFIQICFTLRSLGQYAFIHQSRWIVQFVCVKLSANLNQNHAAIIFVSNALKSGLMTILIAPCVEPYIFII